MTTVIDESGAVQQWTAVYWRYHAKYDVPCDSFAQAYRLLESGEEDGELSSVAILGPDGEVLMDKPALFDAHCAGLDPEQVLIRLSAPREIGGAS